MVTLTIAQGFIHKRKSSNRLLQHCKQYHLKILPVSFLLNGHTIGFQPQTSKLNRVLMIFFRFDMEAKLCQARENMRPVPSAGKRGSAPDWSNKQHVSSYWL